MHIGANIRIIRLKWKLSQADFAILIKATRGMVMQYETRGSSPKDETVSNLLKLTGISIEDLENTILKSDDIPELPKEASIIIRNHKLKQREYEEISEDDVQELTNSPFKRKPKIDDQPKKGMPVFESAPITLSNIESYRDGNQNEEPDFWLNIPQYRNCDYATRAKGDSMHPLIRNMALVGGRRIFDASIIVYGDLYIVHTSNGIETIKYVHPDPDNPEQVLLVPYNNSAKTTPIRKEDISKIFQAEFVLNPL